MARPYPDSFERESSSPLSPASGSQTPISFQANVSRQKTKKWVDAPPADYGGDDWGDDYNDYQPSPPVTKASGLRQPGQVAKPASAIDKNKKAYGELPPLPPDASPVSPARNRPNSFLPNDEQRTFSNVHSGPPTPAATSTAARQVPQLATSPTIQHPASQSNLSHNLRVTTQPPPPTGLRKAGVQPGLPAEAQDSQPPGQAASTGESQPSASSKPSASSTDSMDFRGRRDFSPTAVPPPLQTRSSAVPPGNAAESSPTKFPPRKSSIGQRTSFDIPDSAQEAVAPKPLAEARSSSPSASARSPTSAAKTPPFVRPADIYRRLEEEREKERQSIDSNRPSMDSVVGRKAGERSSSPVAKPTLGAQSSSDSLGEASRKVSVPESAESHEPSKRLAPTLEPVKERKSEYGFDGYDPALIDEASNETKGEGRQEHQYLTAQFNPKDDSRNLSTPKLPSLSRISGFGVDLFSKPESDETDVPGSTSNTPLGTRLSEIIDVSSEAESSIGFKSAVQQAFNTSREIPAFETPISPSSSGAKRTDSESTGTAGISPIMSRVPGVTIAENLARHGDRRGTPTPAITELDSRREPAHVPADLPSHKSTPKSLDNERLPLQQGYRRDIATASPSNSPARTPNLETNGKFPAGEIAHISEIPDTPASPLGNDILQLPRPVVEGEQSFRPGLPGGWASYNTAANGSVINPEHTGTARSETPVAPVSPISEGDEGENTAELTPTATGQSLSQPAINSVATSSASGVAIAAVGGGSIRSPTAFQPPIIPVDGILPTPNTTLTHPSRSHVDSQVNSRLLSDNELEQVKENPSQSPSFQTVAAGISEPALTFLNDSSSEELSVHRSDSIPPTAPLRQKTREEMAAGNDLPYLIHPQTLSNLSTNTSPHDEESDRLRKEIVKSLSPTLADAESRQFLIPPNSLEPGHQEEHVSSGGRESTYLPSEYDNYWASTDDPGAGEQGRPRSASSVKAEEVPVSPMERSPMAPHEVVGDLPVAALLNTKMADNNSDGVQPSKPPNRFSWEAGPEQVSAKGTHINTKLEQQTPVPASFVATPDNQPRRLEESRGAYLEHGAIDTSTTIPFTEPLPVENLPSSKTSMTGERQAKPPTDQRSNVDETKISASLAGGAVVAEPTDAYANNDSRGSLGWRLSRTEETNSANVSPYAILPTSQEGGHPAANPQPLPSNPEASLPGTPASVLTTQQPTDYGKIMQFKEILALPHPSQRIKMFNETRYQFVAMETGLNSWLELLGSQQESAAFGNWGVSNTNVGNTARSRAQKSGGTTSPALQQPYYQQYLNASPTTTPLGSRPGTAGITSGSRQGFSPGNSKSQSKGKDLLHSAGILGGKASKAGKGLLSKGKNRFRGSGSGDKTSSPPSAASSTKPKPNGRRSSWGVSLSSLTLSHASGRDDSSSQHSEDQTPTHQQGTRHRSESLPTDKSRIPNEGELSLWDAPVSAESTPSLQHSLPHIPNTNEFQAPREIGNNRGFLQEDDRADLRVPAPIGKTQPSWDPTNATPIVEEDGFQYEESHSNTLHTNTPASVGITVQTPRIDPSRGGHASSVNAVSYDAPGRATGVEDWVIVSKQEAMQYPKEAPGAGVPQNAATTLPQTLQPQSPTVQNRPPTLPQSTLVKPLPASASQTATPYRQEPAAASAPFQSALAINPGSRQVAPNLQPQHASLRDQDPSSAGPSTFHPSSFLPRPETNRGGPSTFFHNSSLLRDAPSSGLDRVGRASHDAANSGSFLVQPSSPQPLQSSTTWSPNMVGQGKPSPVPPKGGFRGFLRHMPRRSKDNTPTGSPQLAKTKKRKGSATPSSYSMSPQAPQGGRPPAEAYTPILSEPLEVTRSGQFESPQPYSISTSRQSFVGLPPIRRSSTFGLGFSPRLSKSRFPIDDENSEGEDEQQRPLSIVPTPQDIRPPFRRSLEDETALGPAKPLGGNSPDTSQQTPARRPSQEAIRSAVPEGSNRPAAVQASSTEYRRVGAGEVSPISASPPSNRASPQRMPGGNQGFVPIAPPEGFWRSNQAATHQDTPPISQAQQPQFEVQKTAPPIGHQSQLSFDSQRSTSQLSHQNQSPTGFQTVPQATHQRVPSFGIQQNVSQTTQPRQPSYESQHTRSSSVGQGYGGTLGENSGTTPAPARIIQKHQHQKSLEQPPSSAQRYPELFKPGQLGDQKLLDEGELPAHYYQAPVSREEAFLPRQQTNEYQLPGVGPPADELSPGNRPRRNSGLLKEIGGRLSRTTSRDRGTTRDEDGHLPSRPIDSRGNEQSEASITSEDTIEKKTRRSSVFGALTRTTTGGIAPPRANEGMLANTTGSPLAPPDRKRSFFNGSQPSPSEPKQNKPLKMPTGGLVADQGPKKKRFSNLTGMFSRGSGEDKKESGSEATKSLQDNSRKPNPIAPQAPQFSGMPTQSIQNKPIFIQQDTSFINNSNVPPQAPPKTGSPQYSQNSQRIHTSTRPGQPYSSLQNSGNYQGQTSNNSYTTVLSQANTRVPENPESFQRQIRSTSTASQGPQGPAPDTQNIQQRRTPPLVTHVAHLAKDPDHVRQNYPLQASVVSNASQSSQPQVQPPQPQVQSPQPQVQSPKRPQPTVRPQAQASPTDKGSQPVHNYPTTQSTQSLQNSPPFQNSQPTMALQAVPPYHKHSSSPTTASRQPILPPPQLQTDSQLHSQLHRRQLSDSAALTPGTVVSPGASNPQIPQEYQRPMAAPQSTLHSSPENPHSLNSKNSHSLQSNQSRPEKKLRQSSAARLLSGLIGGRRSTEQQERKSTQSRTESPTPPQSISSQQQQPALWVDEPSGSQERGRPLAKEPKYDTPPIPGAYHLVRGEGAQLAPTPYDPRGLNIRFGPQNDPSLLYQYPSHMFPLQAIHIQNQQPIQNFRTGPLQLNGPQPVVLAPPDPNLPRQAAGSPPKPTTPRQASRPLSSEDLMARSPARRPLGQQAPYQLTLPQSPANDDPWDRQLPRNRNPAEREPVRGRQLNIDSSSERKPPADRGVTAVGPVGIGQGLIHPALRQPSNPGNGPSPNEKEFSQADYVPLAKSSSNQLSVHSHGLDRSNTRNTQASDASQISGPKSLNVPGVQRDRAPSVTAPSQQTTRISPERSPERVSRRLSPGLRAEEDHHSTSPRPSPGPKSRTPPIPRVAVQETSDEKAEEAGLSENKARPSEFQGKPADSVDSRTMPPEEKIVSQEEKILADETLLSVEDEVATMSATSYPGQEWHPYMNGYEDWD